MTSTQFAQELSRALNVFGLMQDGSLIPIDKDQAARWVCNRQRQRKEVHIEVRPEYQAVVVGVKEGEKVSP